MSLNIKDIEVSRLAKKISTERGITQTQLIKDLLQREELLIQEEQAIDVEEILAIGAEIAALPVLDSRTAEEILGYDENGLPS